MTMGQPVKCHNSFLYHLKVKFSKVEELKPKNRFRIDNRFKEIKSVFRKIFRRYGIEYPFHPLKVNLLRL